MEPLTITQDTITAKFKELKKTMSGESVMRVVGVALVQTATRAFNDASKRPAPWKPNNAGNPLLKKSGALWKSLEVKSATSDTVTVGSERKYAATHQFGEEIKPKKAKALKFKIGGKWVMAKKVTIPARPYLPITPDGSLSEAGLEAVNNALTLRSQNTET